MKRKRIAIVTHGGIGVGFRSEGLVMMTQLLERLGKKYDITVYSLVKTDVGFLPPGYKVVSVPMGHRQSIRVRMAWLSLKIIRDMLFRPHQLFHAFWAFPSGYLVMMLNKI